MHKQTKTTSVFKVIISIILIISAVAALSKHIDNTSYDHKTKKQPSSDSYSLQNIPSDSLLEQFAKENNISPDEWPKELIDLLNKNPEATDFVLNYPIKSKIKHQYSLGNCLNNSSVPLLMQWDERWGYISYAGELMGLSGCGPTCLSMVCIHLLQNETYTPEYIAAFSEKNGYSLENNGSKWTLISQGGKELGLDISEIPLDENRIIRNLKANNPIICIMGPGNFTTSGHFIVMTDYIDGKIKVNDPNSKIRSEKLWALSDIKQQIRNLWVCRKP